MSFLEKFILKNLAVTPIELVFNLNIVTTDFSKTSYNYSFRCH